MCTSKLISVVLRSSVPAACTHFNTLGMGDYLVSMVPYHDPHMPYTDMSVSVFRVPNEKVPAVWRKLGRDPLTCPVQPERN
jgi:hypothetical protein